MKMIHGLLFRLKGIFTDNNEIDDTEEDDNNPINSNINPTNRQTKVEKYKGDSKKKRKPSHTNNKAIKHRNNNNKKRKKVTNNIKAHNR